MFLRMVLGAVFRQKSKMFMIAFTVALGVSLSTAMLNTMLGVGDKVNQELKTYGANINVVPKDASLLGDLYGIGEEADAERSYLDESKLGNIKTIFWAFNIVDYTPYFNTTVQVNGNAENTRLVGTWVKHHMDLPTGESVDTGMQHLKSWWEMNGEWLDETDSDGVMVGSIYALRNNLSVGDKLELKSNQLTKTMVVRGIFSSGSDEDQYIYCLLPVAQVFAGKENVVSSIEVSALTTPDNELARKAAQNPLSLTVKEWEVWYCTAYVSSICYQIQEVITGSVASAVRQVADSEGAILDKTKLLMLLITVMSLIGSALGISNLVTASVMERSNEIGLMKAVGAQNASVTGLVLTEILVTALLGGTVGFFMGIGFAQIIGRTVFGAAVTIRAMIIPIVAVLVALVTLAGSLPAIRMLLKLEPAEVLHGR